MRDDSREAERRRSNPTIGSIRRALAQPTSSVATRVAGIVVLALLCIWLRGDAILSFRAINPDEAELMAGARRALESWVPFEATATTTHLWAWPGVLSALGHLGVPLTLTTAHVLSALIYLLLLAVAWWILATRIPIGVAALAIIGPAVVLLSGAANNDYLSLGSELLPVALLALSVVMVFGPVQPVRPWVRYAAIAIAGVAPLGKAQALPLAIAVAVAIEWLGASSGGPGATARAARPWRTGRTVTLFVTPSIVIGAVMAAYGSLGPFIRDSVGYQIDYALRRGRIEPWNPAPDLVDRLAGLSTFLGILLVLLPAFLAMGTRSGGSLLLAPWQWGSPPARRALTAAALIVVLAIAGAAAPFPYFAHYGNLVWAGGLLAVAIATAHLARQELVDPRPGDRVPWIAATPLMALLVIPPVITTLPQAARLPTVEPPSSPALTQTRANLAGTLTPSSDFARVCPVGSRVFVWGWAAELYALQEWQPASRYLIGVWQAYPFTNQAQYRRTLAAELRDQPPDCIVEAARPPFLVTGQLRDAMSRVVPELRPLLSACFDRTSVQYAGHSVSVWTRRASCTARVAKTST